MVPHDPLATRHIRYCQARPPAWASCCLSRAASQPPRLASPSRSRGPPAGAQPTALPLNQQGAQTGALPPNRPGTGCLDRATPVPTQSGPSAALPRRRGRSRSLSYARGPAWGCGLAGSCFAASVLPVTADNAGPVLTRHAVQQHTLGSTSLRVFASLGYPKPFTAPYL